MEFVHSNPWPVGRIDTTGVSARVAGRAMLLVGLKGKVGEVYQVGGAHMTSYDLSTSALKQVSRRVPGPRDSSYREIANLIQPRKNPLFWFYDVVASAAAEAFGAKPYVLALIQQTSTRRSDKLEALNQTLKGAERNLAWPSDAELKTDLDRAMIEHVQSLQERGGLRGTRPAGVDLTRHLKKKKIR